MTLRSLFAGAIAAGLAVSAGFAAPAQAFTSEEKSDIEGVVRDYLMAHPEILLDMSQALQDKQEAERKVAQKSAIASVGKALFSSPAGTVLGNPDGDVTVVEFFDYNCTYCKHAMSDMTELLKDDPKVRFVLKEVPLLGPQSVAASHVSLAFRSVAPDKYGEYHLRLLGSRGVVDEQRAIDVAGELGVDEPTLRQAMRSTEVGAAMAESNRLSQALMINGTPSYVVSDEVIPGAVGLDELKRMIEDTRSCGSASC
ncbi:DsbA family protein [Aurantimonas sp. MSK8Z-1]|uniref:DsbA family protein n=1 Tax=Mangrovibrevibacter kandeliae TaxID=2968473 RepID=UPI0021181054|nr:DsbA family protein [Aurantimonas sp. MSK8Z-1]MCW4114662.1 DsbA family protein [Aurantimonas sp. MSK8Z-1]